MHDNHTREGVVASVTAPSVHENQPMDEARFLNTVLNLSDMMYGTALAITGSEEDAKDAVQESVARMWAVRKSMDRIQNVDGYCVKTVRNAAFDIVRRRQTSAQVSEDVEQLPHSDPSPGPHGSMEAKEQFQMLRKCLDMLPDAYRQVLTLRVECDFSFGQIAEIMGTTQDNVRQILSRARKQIKEHYLKNRI